MPETCTSPAWCVSPTPNENICLPPNWNKWTSYTTDPAPTVGKPASTNVPCFYDDGNGNNCWGAVHNGTGTYKSPGAPGPHSTSASWTFIWDSVHYDATGGYNWTSVGYTQENPQVGAVGDFIGVFITNTSNKSYSPYAVRAGNAISKTAVMDMNPPAADRATYSYKASSGTATFTTDSWASTWPAVTDFTAAWTSGVIASTGATVTWDSQAACDTKLWESATACQGIT